MYAYVWVCCIAIDVYRLAEHYLLCELERAGEYACNLPRVFSRATRILGAAFLVSAKKRNFFTLRRNAGADARRVRTSILTFEILTFENRRYIATTDADRYVRARAHLRPSCSTLCVSSCAQPKFSN